VKTYTISLNGLAGFIFFSFGSFINVLAYLTLEPLIVGLVLLIMGYAVLRLFKITEKSEIQAFIITFSICWFWAGVAAVYANCLHDSFQNTSDPNWFYEFVSGDSVIGINLAEINSTVENVGSLVTWKIFYLFFELIGIKGRYIGITVNCIFIGYTSVVGLNVIKRIFGHENHRIKSFTIYFLLCPIFWLFGAIHLRDAAVLLAVTLLMLMWIIYINDPGFGNLIKLGSSTLISFFVFGLLRAEFVFVPLAMLFAGIIAIVIGSSSNNRIRIIVVTLLIALPVAAYLFSGMQSQLFEAIVAGNESYDEMASSESGDTSLGNRLIIASPIPVRLILGSVYLFIFPIPFWSGFQLESAYHLFKSLQALFMYGMTPLFILSVWQIIRYKHLRTTPILFLLFLAIGFTLAVAFTSLETRHFAVFLLPIIILSLLPDLRQKKEKASYLKILRVSVGLMSTVHFVWALMKFL
jgi:hypothetical protein